MKIVLASGIYPPDIGGPATYSKLITEEFKKLGHDVSVICYSDKKGNDVNRILRKYPKPIRYFLYFLKLLSLAKNADTIYAQGPINSGIPAVLSKKLLRVKIVLRLGGDYIWEQVTDKRKECLTLREYYKYGIFKKQGFIFKIFKWVLNSVDLIIFSTEFQRDIYLKYLKIDRKKTIIVKNAFSDIEKINQTRINQILFAGRITRLKNLELLIRVFSTLKKNIQLKIIGEGPDQKRLKSLVKKMDLEKQVIFKDKISHQELLKEIQKSYFTVLPSWTDISPNFVLDCIKLNKPILCTRELGFYDDFKNDLLFFNPCSRKDFLEKLKWLLEEKNYKSYQQKMKKIKIERSWSELTKEHLLIFKKLK